MLSSRKEHLLLFIIHPAVENARSAGTDVDTNEKKCRARAAS
jgi:hypothetical protein